MKLPTPAFDLGATVYQRTAAESDDGIVTGIIARPGGVLLYLVTWGVDRCDSETSHWKMELTTERAFGGSGES